MNVVKMQLYGLEEDGYNVRGEVYSKKIELLVKALHKADLLENTYSSFDYFVSDTSIKGASDGSGSCLSASLFERPKNNRRNKKKIPTSSIVALGDSCLDIYEQRYPRYEQSDGLVESIKEIGNGVEKKFSLAEMVFNGSQPPVPIRVDRFLVEQCDLVLSRQKMPDSMKMFSGVSFGSYQGFLKLWDERGNLPKGSIIQQTTNQEIECIFEKGLLDIVRPLVGQRVRVHGTCHYAPNKGLPTRIDVKIVEAMNEGKGYQHLSGEITPIDPEELEGWRNV